MATRHPRDVDQMQPAGDRVIADADPRRTRPRGNGELDHRLVRQLHVAVVGDDDLDVDTLAAQLERQPGSRRGEPPDGGDRRELSGREQHTHQAILAVPDVGARQTERASRAE